MKILMKKVYYCGFCKKHGLSRPAMELHERVCTLNPDRKCRWKLDGHPENVNIVVLSGQLREKEPIGNSEIDWLRAKVGGCPACMLAALRQSGVVQYHHDRFGKTIFDYQQEVDRAREDERESWRRDELVF